LDTPLEAPEISLHVKPIHPSAYLFFFAGFSDLIHVERKTCDARMFATLPTTASIVTVELMLVLRVLALYGNSLGLARYLVIQFFVQVIASSILSGFVLSATRKFCPDSLKVLSEMTFLRAACMTCRIGLPLHGYHCSLLKVFLSALLYISAEAMDCSVLQ